MRLLIALLSYALLTPALASERQGEYLELFNMRHVREMLPASKGKMWVIAENKDFGGNPESQAHVYFCEPNFRLYGPEWGSDFKHTMCRVANFYRMEYINGCHVVSGILSDTQIRLHEAVVTGGHGEIKYELSFLWLIADVGITGLGDSGNHKLTDSVKRTMFRCQNDSQFPFCLAVTTEPYLSEAQPSERPPRCPEARKDIPWE